MSSEPALLSSPVTTAKEDNEDDDDDEDADGLVFLDLSGNFIEGKAKANEKVKAKLSKTLGKVSGLMGKVSKKMGAVGEVLEKGLSEADKQLAPKQVPTKAGGTGALATAIITKPPGGITLRRLNLVGCGLEKRHVKLLAKVSKQASKRSISSLVRSLNQKIPYSIYCNQMSGL